jgi:glutamine synthetase
VQSKDRATSSVAARRAVLKRIKDEGVEHVLFWFTDLEGHLKSFAITPDEMEGALDDGMGFDGSSITGFNAIEESDMVAIPTRRRSSSCRGPSTSTGTSSARRSAA